MLIQKICRNFPKRYKVLGYPVKSIHQTKMSKDISNSKKLEFFQNVLPSVIDVLLNSDKFENVPDIKDCVKKIVCENIKGGKLNRGLTTVFAYEMFEKPENVTEESLKLARILGWCVEMMQAHFLILDDIMDSSITRRGVPCWYKQPDVGLRAINDGLLVKCCYNEIIRMFFKEKPYYVELFEIMDNILFNTVIGQHLDIVTASSNKDFSEFTMDRYNAIIKYKTAYYTYSLPLALGLLLTNNTDKQAHKQIESISLDIGCFFQVQDDFIDVFGDPKMTGKQGTDIIEGKCCWTAVTALEHFTPAQREVFNRCYGTKDKEDHERIMQLYNDINLQSIYRDYEKRQYECIKQKIQALPPSLSPDLFNELIANLYQRKY